MYNMCLLSLCVLEMLTNLAFFRSLKSAIPISVATTLWFIQPTNEFARFEISLCLSIEVCLQLLRLHWWLRDCGLSIVDIHSCVPPHKKNSSIDTCVVDLSH